MSPFDCLKCNTSPTNLLPSPSQITIWLLAFTVFQLFRSQTFQSLWTFLFFHISHVIYQHILAVLSLKCFQNPITFHSSTSKDPGLSHLYLNCYNNWDLRVCLLQFILHTAAKSWQVFPLLRIPKGITMQKALYDLVATPSLTSFLIICLLNPSAIISSFEVTFPLCEVHSL